MGHFGNSGYLVARQDTFGFECNMLWLGIMFLAVMWVWWTSQSPEYARSLTWFNDKVMKHGMTLLVAGEAFVFIAMFWVILADVWTIYMPAFPNKIDTQFLIRMPHTSFVNVGDYKQDWEHTAPSPFVAANFHYLP